VAAEAAVVAEVVAAEVRVEVAEGIARAFEPI